MSRTRSQTVGWPAQSATGDVADLLRINTFKGLTEADLAPVAAKSRVHDFNDGAHVTLDTDLSESAFFVREGAGRIVALSPDGAGVTMWDVLKGGAFGIELCLPNHSYGHHASRLLCARGTSLLAIKRKDLRQCIERSLPLCLACLKHVSTDQLELTTRYFELATLDVRGRLIAELTRLSARGQKLGDQLVVSPSPTHVELGEKIGAAREAITRQLQALEDDGLIEVGRRRIVIKDEMMLRELDERIAGRRQFLRRDG